MLWVKSETTSRTKKKSLIPSCKDFFFFWTGEHSWKGAEDIFAPVRSCHGEAVSTIFEICKLDSGLQPRSSSTYAPFLPGDAASGSTGCCEGETVRKDNKATWIISSDMSGDYCIDALQELSVWYLTQQVCTHTHTHTHGDTRPHFPYCGPGRNSSYENN